MQHLHFWNIGGGLWIEWDFLRKSLNAAKNQTLLTSNTPPSNFKNASAVYKRIVLDWWGGSSKGEQNFLWENYLIFFCLNTFLSSNWVQNYLKRLPMPGSSDEGPRWLFLSFIVKILILLARIGAAWDYIWWTYFLEKHQPAPTGHYNDHINTGVFIIRPGEHYINGQSILGSDWCESLSWSLISVLLKS